MPGKVVKRSTATAPVVPQQQSAVQAMNELAARYSMDAAALTAALKATVLPQVKDPKTKQYRDPTMGEVYGFVLTANAYRLNPFLKEIYAFPNKHGGMSPVVGVDGWISLMQRHPDFDGIEFEWGDEVDYRGHTGPEFVTVRIRRKNLGHPIEVTEFFAECYRDTDPWNQMPRRMMRNKGIVQGGRVAFGFTGIYDEDEARDQAPREVEVEQAEEAPAPMRTLDDVAKRLAGRRQQTAPVELEAEPAPAVDDYGPDPPDVREGQGSFLPEGEDATGF